MVLRALGISLVLGLAACASASADENVGDDAPAALSAGSTTAAAPANFLEVRPGLYRGGHPDTAGMAYLKSIGIKRIVDLEVADFVEAFPWDITQELHDAKAAGIEELQHPMSAFEPAVSDDFDADQDAIRAILASATPDNPVYVHCKHGQDRTGLVVGLERVFVENWSPSDAHAEMVKIGFHTYFLGLEDYFERKTGFSD